MTGAIFRFIRCTIARNSSGSKVLMDLLKAAHGPQNIPATKADRTMLMSSNIFRVMVISTQCFILTGLGANCGRMRYSNATLPNNCSEMLYRTCRESTHLQPIAGCQDVVLHRPHSRVGFRPRAAGWLPRTFSYRNPETGRKESKPLQALTVCRGRQLLS